METIFESFDGQKIITISDEKIVVNLEKESATFSKLMNELGKEVEDLKSFVNQGIPGKIKITRKYQNKDDISKLLTELHIPFYSYTIDNTEAVDEFSSRVVNIDDYRLRCVLNNNKCIREFGDRYEYCLVKNYENLYHEPVIDSIQFDDVFVQLLTDKNTRVIVSIDFQKDMFKIVDILDWINKNSVKILRDKEDRIEDAWNMIEGLKFKDLPIVLYRKGFETIHININSLREVTDEFIPGIQRINTMNSKEIDSLDNKGEIFLNGRKIDYIPEIRIDLGNDLLISNGHIFVASYLGDYGGCIGLFEEEGDDLPLAWIYDTETKVYIDIYENDNRKVIFVEHSYAIDIDSLLNI